MFKRKEKELTDSEALMALPHNRKELFFDLLKNRKMALFALSCYVFFFFIPFAVDLFIFNYLESMAIASDKLEYLFSLIFYSMLIAIPCLVIGFLGFAGGFYVIKKMVWQEGISTSVDFFTGIKENWKRAILNGLLFSVILFGLVVGSSYLLIFTRSSPILCGVGIGALILLFIVFGIVATLNLTQDVYYTNGVGATLKNSFCFLGLTNWKVLVTFLMTTGVVVALSALNMITLAIGLFLFAILNSLVIVIYTLIAHSAFDKYINQEHYPDFVNKGLYKKEEVVKDNKEA